MQARIEELSSSDDDAASDPEEMDITDFSASPLVPRTTFGHSNPNSSTFQAPSSAGPSGQTLAPPQAAQAINKQPPRPAAPTYDRERVKNWQCLYPLYFDAGKTRAEGRRVSKELAVTNPLAREIAQAVGRMGFKVAFEPGACHPKDWANPGRVKVCMKENGKAVGNTIDVGNSKSCWCLELLGEEACVQRSTFTFKLQRICSSIRRRICHRCFCKYQGCRRQQDPSRRQLSLEGGSSTMCCHCTQQQ